MTSSRSHFVTVAFGTAVVLLLVGVSLIGCKKRSGEEDDKSPGVMEAAKRAPSMNNLKNLAQAMHFYENDNGRFPPAAQPAMDGSPGLSWRVLVLPYVDEGNLFKQFKLNEPWDSPNNKKLIEHMPRIYQPVMGEPKPGMTYYQVFTGPGTIFETPRKLAPGQTPNAMRATGIQDGASQTILIIEAGDPVVWTKPDDLVYDDKKPIPKLGGLFSDRIHAALADAAPVTIMKTGLDEKLLRLAITCRDGQFFETDKLFGRGSLLGK